MGDFDDLTCTAAFIGGESQLPMYRTDRVSSMADKDKRSALADTKVAAIDLDGVVYQGTIMIAGADAAISGLRQRGLQVVFATNSSVRTRADIATKLGSMGIPAEEDDILTSAYAAGHLVKNIGGTRVLVIGADSLKEEIARFGASVASGTSCDTVVVGMDTGFSYDKMQAAMEAIAGGAVFVACNRDASFPGDNGRIFPGCGPMVAAIEAAVGFPPNCIAGKPSVLMLQIIAARCRVRPREILVVGDGMDSDIKMATSFGSPSVLVAPGPFISSSGTAGPTCIIESLADLPSLLEDRAGF